MSEELAMRLKARDAAFFNIKKVITTDKKVERLLVYFDSHENKWPPRKYKDPADDLALGSFCSQVRTQRIKVSEELAMRLKARDAAFFNIRNREAQKMITDEKVERILVYFDSHENKWPPQKYKDDDLALGIFCSDVRRRHVRVTKEQAMRLIERDAGFFNIRKSSKAGKAQG